MLLAKGKIAKVVILRSGALGDVLAIRSVIRFVKDAFPDAAVCLAAPGERGRFFAREGWADQVHDSDRAAFSWLHSGGESDPPIVLQAIFAASDIVVSYLDFASSSEFECFAARLDALAPAAGKIYCPSRPPEAGSDHGCHECADGRHEHGERPPIGEWLLRAVREFCRRYSLLGGSEESAHRALATRVGMVRPKMVAGMDSYHVIHPGSGSEKKNWPLERFIGLAKLLRCENMTGGSAVRPSTLVVTAGEADADLGERLALSFPGALLLRDGGLDDVAALLAYANLYIGNDSGISHLAAAVEREDGGHPLVVSIFGPSDPCVWAPPGAMVLRAGPDMNGLTPPEVLSAIKECVQRNRK